MDVNGLFDFSYTNNNKNSPEGLIFIISWSHLPDLNWGPSLYKSVALPTELRWQIFIFQKHIWVIILTLRCIPTKTAKVALFKHYFFASSTISSEEILFKKNDTPPFLFISPLPLTISITIFDGGWA